MSWILHLSVANWITIVGALVAAESAIAQGTIKLTNAIPDKWVPTVQAWCGILAAFGAGIITVLSRFVTVALIALLVLSPLAGQALAQAKKKPALTGNPVQDIQNAIAPVLAPGQPVGNAPCDFNLFAALQARNLGSQIAVCAVGDIKAALDSATAAKDTVGVACLTPALAIVQAAAGATQQVETNAPPVPGTAAPQSPVGLILLFQKYREFVLAGGPTSCKSWVNTTLSGGNPLTQ